MPRRRQCQSRKPPSRGSVKTPDNSDAAITEISFKLTGPDYEAGELIAVNTTFGSVTTADGDFTVDLSGVFISSGGGSYVLAAYTDGASDITLKGSSEFCRVSFHAVE